MHCAWTVSGQRQREQQLLAPLCGLGCPLSWEDAKGRPLPGIGSPLVSTESLRASVGPKAHWTELPSVQENAPFSSGGWWRWARPSVTLHTVPPPSPVGVEGGSGGRGWLHPHPRPSQRSSYTGSKTSGPQTGASVDRAGGERTGRRQRRPRAPWLWVCQLIVGMRIFAKQLKRGHTTSR